MSLDLDKICFQSCTTNLPTRWAWRPGRRWQTKCNVRCLWIMFFPPMNKLRLYGVKWLAQCHICAKNQGRDSNPGPWLHLSMSSVAPPIPRWILTLQRPWRTSALSLYCHRLVALGKVSETEIARPSFYSQSFLWKNAGFYEVTTLQPAKLGDMSIDRSHWNISKKTC